MNRVLILAVIALVATLAGCGVIPKDAPIRVNAMTPDELRNGGISSIQLCQAYHLSEKNRDNIEAELRDRDRFTASEWRSIKSGNIRSGMSEIAVICVLGKPTDINTTVSVGNTRKQYVYRSASRDTSYVHFEGGKVTSYSF